MPTCNAGSGGGSKGKGGSKAMTAGGSKIVASKKVASGDKVSSTEARDLFDSPVGTKISVKSDDGRVMYTLEKTGPKEWTKDGKTKMTSAAPFGSNIVGKSVTISKVPRKASKEGITTTKSKSGAKIITMGPTAKLTSRQVKGMAAGTTINFGSDWRYVKMSNDKWRVFKNGKRQADRSTNDIIYVVAT